MRLLPVLLASLVMTPATISFSYALSAESTSPETIGQARCAQCHDKQNEWWFDDDHHDAADPLLAKNRRFVEVARRYGLTAEQMTKGDQICARCHATVITSSRENDVRAGVSCESCHGAAENWLSPHQSGDKSLGRSRPGYVEALGLGLRELRKPAVLAKNCMDCHLISDVKLRATGHPDGLGWNLADLLRKIEHWEEPLPPLNELQVAFDRERVARGPFQRVKRPLLVTSSGKRARRPERRRFSRRQRSDATRPRPSRSAEGLDLGPAPVFDESITVADRLKLLDDQFELLRRKTSEL